VLKFRSTSPFIQLYLDQAYSAAIGQALNGAIAKQFAGKATPAQVVAQIEAAAKKK
jgi:raffinose/stachyose/melibiose transport system substrate-binding protein